MRPVTDRAEVSLDFPDKTYMGQFGRSAAFEAEATPDAVRIKLAHGGDQRRVVDLHVHWYLFADILDALATSLENGGEGPDDAHREAVLRSLQRLSAALGGRSEAAPGTATAV